jgi:branched-subunit amino acid aminotransferase/4-amino-4-deoxychorismate lyase
MRMQVINLALAHGIKVYECSILPQNLLAADEVFITNAIKGINWIGGYRTKTFSNSIARKLIIALNESWRKKLEV